MPPTAEIARNVTETAAAANEVTSRTHEVTAAAGRAGRQSEEVRENSAALEGAVHAMHHMVIRLVRTSATEIDRRRCRRRLCFVEATVATSGNTDNARLHDISERGCYAVGALHLSPGQDVVVAVPHFGARADGNVIESSENGAHIAFHGDGLTAATVDRISLESVADLARQARNDHIAFVKHVVEIVAAGHKLPPDELASSRNCRFGQWYDNVSDPVAMALPAFKALAQPHKAVHEFGRKTLIALCR